MAVTHDIVHNLDDIHPSNKHDVGRRLARWALAKTYDRQELTCSGPLYRTHAIEDDKIRVYFDHTADELTTRDGMPPNAFEVSDQTQFYPATARIEGQTVVVSSEEVPNPQQIRFGLAQSRDSELDQSRGLTRLSLSQ